MLPQEKVQNLIDRHLKLEKELSKINNDVNTGVESDNAIKILENLTKNHENSFNFD